MFIVISTNIYSKCEIYISSQLVKLYIVVAILISYSMDLRNFRESSKPTKGKTNFFSQTYKSAKDWVLPPTNDKRKERYSQYKDFGLFLTAAAVITYFQEDISRLL
jgi:hypothetical protein